MIQCTITVLLAWFLVTSAAAQNAEDVDRLWQFEQPGIDKIARLTYAEHATILFSLGGEVVAYASAGRVQKLSCTTGDTACKVWDAALSHDGRFVAYIEAPVPDTSKNQRLVLQNIETGERRVVLEGMGRTSLSWSWDDSEIAYPEAPYSWGPQSAIYALSVHDGSTRVVTQLVKFIEERQRKGERIEDVSAPIQWAHGGERQVVGLTVQVPTGKPQESQPEFRIYIATQAGLSIFRTGWCPAVSPVADQVAYFDDNKVKLANLDGSQERVLTGIVEVAAEQRDRDLEQDAAEEGREHDQGAGPAGRGAAQLASLAGEDLARRLDGAQGAEAKVGEDDEDDPERGGELRRERNGCGGEQHDDGPRERGFDQQQGKAGDVLGEDDVAQADRREQIELHARGVRAEDVVNWNLLFQS